MLSDPLAETFELVSAILLTLKDQLAPVKLDDPAAAVAGAEELRGNVVDVLDELATAFTELAEGDTEEGKDRIEAIAGALDPSLLEDDEEEAAEAAPEET